MEKEFQKFKLAYQRTIEKSLVIVLAFLITILHIFPKSIQFSPKPPQAVNFTFTVEMMPITVQRIRRGLPPEKPVVPVPSEDPDVPLDATIDETIIDWNLGDSPFGNAAFTSGGQDTIPARPLVQILPEYPQELQKLNIRGTVKLMLWVNEAGRVVEAVIVENKTGSKKCADAALEAAKKNTYVPATIGARKVASWVVCIYSYKPE